jgi:hypothetical protein
MRVHGTTGLNMTIKRTQIRNIVGVKPPLSSLNPAAFPPTAPSTEYTSSSRWTSAKTDIVRPAGTDASQNAVNHIAARALLSVLPVEQKIIDTMPGFLIGQESNRDAFQFVVKELLSPTRLHAPAIVLTGTRGRDWLQQRIKDPKYLTDDCVAPLTRLAFDCCVDPADVQLDIGGGMRLCDHPKYVAPFTA